VRDTLNDPVRAGAPGPGSMWITARAAAIGDVVYQRLPPVLVVVLETQDVDGVSWLNAVTFGIDEHDAHTDEVVLDASESTLGLPMRVEVNQRLRLLAVQLERTVGHVGGDALEDLRAAAAGHPAARRQGTAAAQRDGRTGRPDLAVLMVLQEPWWRATDRGSR
jgi:hypothetical protein